MLKLINRKHVMGDHTNSRVYNVVVWAMAITSIVVTVGCGRSGVPSHRVRNHSAKETISHGSNKLQTNGQRIGTRPMLRGQHPEPDEGRPEARSRYPAHGAEKQSRSIARPDLPGDRQAKEPRAMTYEEQFQLAGKDGKEFRGAPFWSWNDELDPEELRRQVRSMRESGMGGFFMHARAGLITPYMSQEYFDCHRACIEEAKRLGMDAWLYDEDRWPSGSAGGMVPAKGPLFQAKTLVMDRVVGGECEPSERTVGVYRYEVFREQVPETPAAEGDTVTGYERVPDSALVDAKGRPLLHFHWRSVGYLDVMSEKAVAQFIDSTHDAFAKVFSADFGVIPGIFTDEPNYNGRGPWTLDFVEEFRSRRGYDILDRLPEIYFPVGDYRKTRLDYWRTVTELYVRAFSKQIYDWCEAHNLKLTGHQLYEDNLEVQIRHIGAAMPHYEYMQVPGIDHLSRQIADPVLVKQVSSVAHQFGGRRVLSEMFGGSGWNLSFEDQKWIGEWQYALGVNLMCQHLCLYSLKGWRKRDYPPSIYYQQPWWSQYNTVEDHFARLACALTMGKHVAGVLVIHPIESAWAEFDPLKPSPEIGRLNDAFVQISEYLQEMHVDYDYGDESILEQHVSIQDEEICVGDARYSLIVLPPVTTIRRSTMDLLREWIADGGAVIVCREMPSMIDGEPSEEPRVILEDQPVVAVDFEALKGAVHAAIEPSVQVLDEYGSDARTIYYHQRDLGGKQLFFFVNIDNQDVRYDSVIRFNGSGKVEEWDLDTGDITELNCSEIGGHTVVEREFAPTQSRLLSFDPTQPPKTAAPERWMVADDAMIDGPWRLSRKDPNAITLDYCRYRIAAKVDGGGFEIHPHLGDGEFSDPVPTILLGKLLADVVEETPVTLQYVFHTDFTEQKDRRFVLVMECPEQYEIKVNGHRITYLDSGWWCDVSFKKIDINLFAQPGENVIEMTCKYLGQKGRGKKQEALGVVDLRSRMWTNPPDDVADPIIIPYSGDVAKTIKLNNQLKLGLDLESVYVLGEFAVAQPEPGKFVLTDETPEAAIGNLSQDGYCFYRGTLIYETSFNYTNRGEDRLLLALDRMGGIIADVFVNGQKAGSLKWRPLEVDISGLVRPGTNELRVEITNSCRNLLGPHHHARGELICVNPGSFGPQNEWTDDYNFVETGLVTPPKLVYMRRE